MSARETTAHESEKMARGPQIDPDVRIILKMLGGEFNEVSFDEWLKMKEGKMTDERVSREKKLFNDADKDKDDSITWKEFLVMTTKRTTQRED